MHNKLTRFPVTINKKTREIRGVVSSKNDVFLIISENKSLINEGFSIFLEEKK